MSASKPQANWRYVNKPQLTTKRFQVDLQETIRVKKTANNKRKKENAKTNKLKALAAIEKTTPPSNVPIKADEIDDFSSQLSDLMVEEFGLACNRESKIETDQLSFHEHNP